MLLSFLDRVCTCTGRHNSAHGASKAQVLNWQVRMNVCQGVAQGLYYLHASSQSRIIHRDIKASNILLDHNLHPKIADFGLARPIEDKQSVIMTQQCAGTLYAFFRSLATVVPLFERTMLVSHLKCVLPFALKQRFSSRPEVGIGEHAKRHSPTWLPMLCTK